MRIQHDTGQKMKFVRGDEEYARQWDRYSGTAQFIENKIALTSPPGAAGMLYLKNSAGHGDLNISAKLEGNVIGKQTIYVRYDRLKESKPSMIPVLAYRQGSIRVIFMQPCAQLRSWKWAA